MTYIYVDRELMRQTWIEIQGGGKRKRIIKRQKNIQKRTFHKNRKSKHRREKTVYYNIE